MVSKYEEYIMRAGKRHELSTLFCLALSDLKQVAYQVTDTVDIDEIVSQLKDDELLISNYDYKDTINSYVVLNNQRNIVFHLDTDGCINGYPQDDVLKSEECRNVFVKALQTIMESSSLYYLTEK